MQPNILFPKPEMEKTTVTPNTEISRTNFLVIIPNMRHHNIIAPSMT